MNTTKIEFAPNMTERKIWELFKTIFATEKGLKKSLFRQYYKLYKNILDNNILIRELFENGNLFIVTMDGKEISTSSMVKQSDNHGYITTWVVFDKLLSIKWKKIYMRPRDLTIAEAFELAKIHRHSNGKIKLTKSVQERYRFTHVDTTNTIQTFALFCDWINGFNSK